MNPYTPLTPQQYQAALDSGFTADQIIENEQKRKASATPEPTGFFPRLSHALDSTFDASAHGAAQAVNDLRTKSGFDAKVGALRDLLGSVAKPYALPAAVVAAPAMLANPVGVAGAVAGGMGVGLLGQEAAKAMHAGPGVTAVAGDVGNVAGGLLGTLTANTVLPKLLGGAARGLANSALGIRPQDRSFGKTPGEAILNETRGLSPEAVSASARERLNQLNPQLDAMAAQSKSMTSLKPALSVIDDAIAKAQSQNAAGMVSQLRELRTTLTTNATNGLSLSPTQTAEGILNLKRGFSNEHISNWKPETMKGVTGVAGNAYGKLDSEFDAAVPGGAELNRRVSSLIPVAQRGETVSRGADFVQRVMQRFQSPTGALVGATGGFLAGGPIGGVVGLLAPAVLADSRTQMAAARALHGAKIFTRGGTKLPYWLQGLLGNVTQLQENQ